MGENYSSEDGKFQWTAQEAEKPERAVVIVPEIHNEQNRTRDARMGEAIGLANAISLDVIDTTLVVIKRIQPATLMGSGKVKEIAERISDALIGLAIVDHTLTPVQQQNLEKAWDCKVLDRTGLILEIFGERAQTKEGRLQVELAHLNYQKGRLVRSWTHLERQRGGLGFVGGPGETQIEADRRMIQERINRLERDLEKVRKTRDLHRRGRKKVPHPIVSFVGYTNAGKSTLFNYLTDANVMAKDQLFATLDPTLRQLNLPMGTKVILSDTVGFVSNLPTHLIAAFRATLEEVLEADLVLHVRDIAHEDTDAQAEDVYKVLAQLGVGDDGREGVLEIWNKTDLLDEDTLSAMQSVKTSETGPILLSAVTGNGTEKLLEKIEERIAGSDDVVDVLLPIEELGKLPSLYKSTHVIERLDLEDGSVRLTIRANREIRKTLTRFLT